MKKIFNVYFLIWLVMAFIFHYITPDIGYFASLWLGLMYAPVYFEGLSSGREEVK